MRLELVLFRPRHALSESFYKEAILEKLQDLVEDVEASEL